MKSFLDKLTPKSSILDGSVLLGFVMAAGFYAVVGMDQFEGGVIRNYTTEHFTEYVIVSMLCWGLADLMLRSLKLPRESAALRKSWLPKRQGAEPISRAEELLESLAEAPPAWQQSRLGKRFREAISYVAEKRSADGFDDHLRDLSDQDDSLLHAAYSVPRFVIWVAPVLGFLGTVVHFGRALGSLTPDSLSENLPVVVAGMGTAFDTTTMALATSVAMMLLMFLVERTDRSLLSDVDRRAHRELSNRFAARSADLAPFMDAVAESAKQQQELWPQVLAGIDGVLQDSLRRQTEFWNAASDARAVRDSQFDAAREERLQRLLDQFAAQTAQRTAELRTNAEQVANLQRHLAALTEALASLLPGEKELLTLQQSLAENLRILHETQHLDRAVNNLAGAVNLLTARQHGPASKAA